MKVQVIKLARKKDPISKDIPQICDGESFVGELCVPSDELIEYLQSEEQKIIPVPTTFYVPVKKFELVRGWPFMIQPFVLGMRSSKVFDFIVFSEKMIKEGKDKFILPSSFPIKDISVNFLSLIESGDMLVSTANSLYLIKKIKEDLCQQKAA